MSTLAVTIAISPALLNNTQMAIPGAVYGIVMFFTAAGFGLVTRGQTAAATPDPTVGVRDIEG
jgi:bile acid:Na+ symporter, BASS family